MAERERFATRMINPGNPMQFTKSAQAPQANNQASNQMAQMAKQLLSFSDSFVGAVKAKFEYDDREDARQEKIAKQIKKEYTTEQELLGRTERRRNNLLRQEQRNILLSPIAQRGWMLQDYEFKRDTRNKYLKTHSKKMANSIFNAYNEEKDAGNIKYTSLEKFASTFIEARRSAFIDTDFSNKSQKEGEEPIFTVTKEAQEVLDKKGLDFTSVFEEVAKLSVDQQDTINRAIKQKQVQTHVRSTYPPITYEQFKQRVRTAQINVEDNAYFTEEEIINEWVRDIQQQLNMVTSSKDPVFKSLDFLTTDKDGVDLLNNGYLTENSRDGVKTIGDEVAVLHKKLKEEQERLEAEEFTKSENWLIKQDKETQQKASGRSRYFKEQLQVVTTIPGLERVIEDLKTERVLGVWDKGTDNDTQLSYNKILELYNQRRKDISASKKKVTKAEGDTLIAINNLSGRIKALKIDDIKSEDIDLLGVEAIKYYDYNEIQPALNDITSIRKALKDREDAEFVEAEEIGREIENGTKIERISDLREELRKLEQNPKRTDKQIKQLTERIKEELVEYKGDEDYEKLNDRMSSLSKNHNETDRTARYEENGLNAIRKARDILSGVNDEIPGYSLSDIDSNIDDIDSNNTILVGDRKEAIKILNDAKTIIQGKQGDKNLSELRREIYTNSEKKEELEKLLSDERILKTPDLLKEVQSYINNLNNREANQEFYWKTYNKRVEDSKARLKERIKREEERRKEEREFRKKLKEEEREHRNTLKLENRSYNEAEKRKFWKEKQKDIKAHQLVMYEKRKKDAADLRKKYKVEDQRELSESLKRARKASDTINKLMEDYELADTQEAKEAVITEFKSDTVQKIFKAAPNNSSYEAALDFFLKQKTDASKNNRSIANQKIASQSEQRRNTLAGNTAVEIDKILTKDEPNFDNARKLLMRQTVVQKYYVDDGRIEPESVDTLPLSKRIEYSSKIRARELTVNDKKNNVKEEIGSIAAHLTLENTLREFPFELSEGDGAEKSLETTQQDFIATFWNSLSTSYKSRDINRTTFNQLKNDLEKIQSSAEERTWFMVKTAPHSPIKNYEDMLKSELANPNSFHFTPFGGATFFGAETNRKTLLGEMVLDYRTQVNNHHYATKGWVKDLNAQEIKCKEIYDSLLLKYEKRINKVNDMLNINSSDDEPTPGKSLNDNDIESTSEEEGNNAADSFIKES